MLPHALSHAFVEITIERSKGKYFVLITDAHEINQIANLTKQQALKVYGALALVAIESGFEISRKPLIINRPAKAAIIRDKPLRDYPMSYQFTQWLQAD